MFLHLQLTGKAFLAGLDVLETSENLLCKSFCFRSSQATNVIQTTLSD